MAPITKEMIDKLDKVRNLADRATTQGEAQAAAMAFQRLLDGYGLSESEARAFMEEQNAMGNKVHKTTGDGAGINQKQHWRYVMASIIADNTRCYVYWEQSYWATGVSSYKIVFVGLEHDAVIARTTYDSMTAAALRLYKKYANHRKAEEYATGSPRWSQSKGFAVKKSYLDGFNQGLAAAYRENQCDAMAIILVKPAAVIKAYEDEKLTIRKSTTSLRSDFDALVSGFEAGHGVGKGNRVSE